MSLLTINPYYLQNSSIVTQEKPTNPIGEKIRQLAYATLLPLNLICTSQESTISICKKLNQNIIPFIESLKNLPLVKVLDSTISIMNGVQIGSHVDYLVNAKYVKDSIQTIAGKMTLFFSQISECMLWILKIAGKIQPIALNILARGSLAFSHILFSTNDLYRLMRTKNSTEKEYLEIELTKHIAECALALAMISNTVSNLPIAVLASACIGLEMLRLIHKEQHVNDLQ